MYREYELPAMGQRQKSFYGKARIQETQDGKTKVLISYTTTVASYDHGAFKRHWDGYSATTQRHVNAFRAFCGQATPLSKAEWDALPVED